MSKRANSATGGARGARAGKQARKRTSGRTNRPNEEAKPPRMRIIAGAWRGRPIVTPKGEGTRPTTDRVREAVMSAVSSARGGFDDAVVLDAFAGSGALGLEALSRGAASAHFYEVESAALRALRANCEKLGCARGAGQGRGLRGPAELLGGPGALPPCGPSTERAHVHRDDVLKRPPVHVRPPFDLLFLDPPYAYDAAEVLRALVGPLCERGGLAPEALIVYEHDHSQDLFAPPLSGVLDELQLSVESTKVYGGTVVEIMRHAAEPTAQRESAAAEEV